MILSNRYRPDPGILLAILGGAALFVMITGGRILAPGSVGWLSQGDPATHYLGWQYFRNTPLLQWPLGANPSYGMELASSIVFTDSIPLLAFLFKPFNAVLPAQFQYHGLWLLLCFALQAAFAYVLLGRIVRDTWLQVVGSMYFVVAPVFLWRLHTHHALLGQWLILAGLFIYFDPRFRPAWWIGLLAVAGLTQVYLLLMLGAIWVADLLQRALRQELARFQLASTALLTCCTLLLVTWIAGYFMVGSGFGNAGFGFYRMNLLALVDPQDNWSRVGWSRTLRDRPEAPGDYEGFAFLGLGVLALGLIVAADLFHRRSLSINYAVCSPIAFAVLGLTVLALSNRIAVGGHELLSLPLPHSVETVLSAIRSSGRLAWPFHYLLMVSIFYLLFTRFRRNFALCLSATLLVVQLVDSAEALRHFRNKFKDPTASTTPMQSPLWREFAKRYKVVIYVLPRNEPTGWTPLVQFAVANGMAINIGYFARVNPAKEEEARRQLKAQVLANEFRRDALYVFDDDELWNIQVSRDAATGVVGVLDGFRILAPDMHECKACDLTGLRPAKPKR